MRELRTTATLRKQGISESRLRWAVKAGRWTRIVRGVYGRGPKPPSRLDIARATALVVDGMVHGRSAGELLNFDGVHCVRPEVWIVEGSTTRAGVRRRTELPAAIEVGQVQCTSAADTLLELATILDDIHWEQTLEFCLRKELVLIGEVARWEHRRVRRVIKLRGGLLVPPTESILETMAVQLIRQDPSIPTPVRQFVIYDEYGNFVGRPDLCWPELGVFLELDGQQHKDQPVYDARRQTRITIATRWRVGRLTWDEVHDFPQSTLRQISELVRPLSTVSGPPIRGW